MIAWLLIHTSTNNVQLFNHVSEGCPCLKEYLSETKVKQQCPSCWKESKRTQVQIQTGTEVGHGREFAHVKPDM